MSRFDNELVRQANNAYQNTVGEGKTTTPRQQEYDQVNLVGTDPAPGVFQAPAAPVDEVGSWGALQPTSPNVVEVRKLDNLEGEIIGGPGSSAVYAEGGPMYASTHVIDESLYQVYKASRDIRNSIGEQVNFDFSNLITAANEASTVMRFASSDDTVNQVIGTVAGIVLDIENDLATYGDYRQASADLKALEGLLEDIKTAATGEEKDPEDDGDEDDKQKGTTGAKKKPKPKAKKKDCKNCKGKGCDDCEDDDEDDDDKPAFLKKKTTASFDKVAWTPGVDAAAAALAGGMLGGIPGAAAGAAIGANHELAKKNKADMAKGGGCTGPGCKIPKCDGEKAPTTSSYYYASNGNQESLQVVDVRDLDDQAGVWDRQRVMQPNHTTNVLVPQEVNGEDAGYVPFYNDGAETGIDPGNGPHKTQLDFNDGTNPALVPYQGVVNAVQASREKIFAAIEVVERLEKMGMVNHDDRAKHIAKFEQMSESKLAGFVASMELFEESGARQPRSQKVAKGNNSLPEMGRLTTASTVTRQDIQSDDWLMTL
jgi:hypothetical protein